VTLTKLSTIFEVQFPHLYKKGREELKQKNERGKKKVSEGKRKNEQ
jgi:hypothetical protein